MPAAAAIAAAESASAPRRLRSSAHAHARWASSRACRARGARGSASARSHNPISVGRDRRVPDAADHERRLGDEVKPPGRFGGIGGGDGVPQARGELACPVLRGGQRDQQLRAFGAA